MIAAAVMMLGVGSEAVFAAENDLDIEVLDISTVENDADAIYDSAAEDELDVESTVVVEDETDTCDYTNILLIGTDRRDESWNGNSDVIIVATINRTTKQLCLTSFMRDLYADIPGYGVHKLNYAYAVGGAETLEATLLSNYEVEIDNYAVVDFEEMAWIVDLTGGVEITVSDEEVDVLNGYLVSMEATESQLPCGGTYVMNGDQAVAYMRIRFVGNDDYERTQRQRNVLRAIFESIDDLSAEDIVKLLGSALSSVENDFGFFDLLRLTVGLPEYLDYTLEETRVPFDGLYDSENEMLVPDFAATTEKLREIMIEGIQQQEQEE
jgi:LCP family protein required for cell wall assembly